MNDNKEILTFSHDRKNLTLYDIKTGDQVAVLKSSRPELDIQNFLVNADGTVALWNTDKPQPANCSKMFVWNLETREEMFVIEREGYERMTVAHAEFTPDGRYFMSSARKAKKSDYIRHTAVWDIQRSKYGHLQSNTPIFSITPYTVKPR